MFSMHLIIADYLIMFGYIPSKSRITFSGGNVMRMSPIQQNH